MITIGAKDLGMLRLKDFCPRCFWFKIKYPIKDKHTFRSPMPRIVSIIDSHTKHVIHKPFKQNKTLPRWFYDALKGTILEDSDNIVDIFPSRNWRARIEDYELTGRPDAIFVLQNGMCLIVDYKTASLTRTQEELFPLYEVQLNAYKYLVECEKLKVRALSLVYQEPVKYISSPECLLELNSEKLTLCFRCTAQSVKIWENRDIEDLVIEAGKILSSAYPPKSNPECEHCRRLSEWLSNLCKILIL